ncbi:MAG TPA: hypothetical protein ENH33_07235 [Actinobacteria bacterium]|nr:hypothetical protein [Actinomycetota bacterium]
MRFLYDWKCARCGRVIESSIYMEAGAPVSERPKNLRIACDCSSSDTLHWRLFPRPQHYAKAKIRTQQTGGKYDTMGMASVEPLPRLQEGQDMKELVLSSEYQDAKRRRTEQHGNNLAKRERARLMRSGADIDLRVDKLPGDHPFIRE